MSLEKTGKSISSAFVVKVTGVKRWNKHMTLRSGKQGPATRYHVEYQATLVKTLLGEWKGEGDQITIRHTIVSPVKYDEDGQALIVKSKTRSGTGLEHSMEVGKTYVVCAWDVFPMGPFHTSYVTTPDKADYVVQTVKRAHEIDAIVKALKAGQEGFSLHVMYEGDEDKPYYRMHIYGGKLPPKRFPPFHSLAGGFAQGEFIRLINHLDESGLLLRSIPANAKMPVAVTPYYYLRINGPKLKTGLIVQLGWGLQMHRDLENLGNALYKDGRKRMGTLLGRLSGHKREWEKAKK